MPCSSASIWIVDSNLSFGQEAIPDSLFSLTIPWNINTRFSYKNTRVNRFILYIATNTTKARPAGIDPALPGGLSGAPLRTRSLDVVRALHDGLDVPIVGVGGVFTGDDVRAMLDAGASLVQTYTGFIYRGPTMARQVHRELS